MMYTSRILISYVFIIISSMTLALPAAGQVAEAQRLLNSMSLDAGPVDGVAGAGTMKAWQAFLQHRGLPLDLPINSETIKELRGIMEPQMPKARGLRFENVGRGFVGEHSYTLFPEDPTKVCFTVRKGDYDPVNYQNSGSANERQYGFPLRKQRAEIQAREELKPDATYTVDFDMMVDSSTAGIIFQIHRGGSGGGMNLSTIGERIVLTAGGELEMVPVLSGDWPGKWHSIRLVFHPATDGQSWFRIYIDGEQTLDTSGRNPRYPMQGAQLHFGLYRGQIPTEANACYRNIAFAKGDLGDP